MGIQFAARAAIRRVALFVAVALVLPFTLSAIAADAPLTLAEAQRLAVARSRRLISYSTRASVSEKRLCR